MSDVYSDAYWTDEFDITEADLERIAQHMRESRSAYDLTELARHIVRGRLRYGPEQSPAALTAWAKDPSVRLWDPAGIWQEGDHVIVARRLSEGSFRAFVGEVLHVEKEHVEVQLDGVEKPAKYLRAARSSKRARQWHSLVRKVVAEERQRPDPAKRVEVIIVQHGERVISRLLDALRSSDRFLSLEGRWLLRELLEPLGEVQVKALHRRMLERTEPSRTDELISLVDPPLPEGDVGLFSLYMALLNHSERFENVGTSTQPLWRAVPPPPPPPERAEAIYYVYDPDTYEILVSPGQRLTPRLAQRLQELNLYDVVVTAADEP